MHRHMSSNREALLKALIILGFSMLLFWLVGSNKIIFYINPRFVWLTKLSAVLIFLMFLVQSGNYLLKSAGHSHTHACPGRIKLIYLPFMFTLFLAFFLPNQALDSSIAQNKGVNLGKQTVNNSRSDQDSSNMDNAVQTEAADNNINSRPYTARNQNPTQVETDILRNASFIEVNENNFTLINNEVYTYPDKYAGKEIAMLGFVVKNEEFQSDQFGLVRYVITCCSADALPGGFFCKYASTSNLSEGSWLNIKGIIDLDKYEGNVIPIIKVTSLSKAKQPQSPYVYY